MLAILAAGWSGALAAEETPIFEEPLSPRTASYEINVTLDDEAKRIDGDLVLTWKNPSDDLIEELQFHLYANAFKNPKSTFLTEWLHGNAARSSDGLPDEVPYLEDAGWGGIRINLMEVDGANVTEAIAFHQPDDGNTDDETVIRVPLPTPITPRASAVIHIAFESKIPQNIWRTGWWHDDFFMMAHWFPKIGVYEAPGTRFVPADAPRGRWNCHQFHAGTEFYADFGVYDVRITLPSKYTVGTTGQMIEQRTGGGASKTIIAHAEDVHEFAWVADPQFREAIGVWRSAATEQEVAIRLLYQPDHGDVIDKYIRSTKNALDYVEDWLGPGAYPYPNITIVDARKGSGAGGMEYPTLFTGVASWSAEKLFGDGLRLVESVTIHEFIHEIWYGVVANNEFEEAWLDEGLTTYTQDRIMGQLFGEKTSMFNWWGASLGSLDVGRLAYAVARHKNDGAIADPTFAHWRSNVGFNLSYNKASVVLKTLENYLGQERFDQILRTYFQRWKFKHPCRTDFIAVANEVAGEDLDWFFDQVIEQSGSLDYAVAAITNVPLDVLEDGIHGDEFEIQDKTGDEDQGSEATAVAEDALEEDGPHRSTVVFRRVGEVVFPMETLVEFSDGQVVRDTWDGRDRVKVYRFTQPGRVVRAAIDPDHRVPLDVDLLNNSLRIERNQLVTNKYTLKVLFWMQSLLQFFSVPA